MADLGETFFTSVGCMDGRVQAPIETYGQNRYHVLFPDTITEAGLVGVLANNPSADLLESIKKKIDKKGRKRRDRSNNNTCNRPCEPAGPEQS